MIDIPDDVMDEAKKQCDLAGVTKHSEMRTHCEHVAAFSILAERERCCKVAAHFTGSLWTAEQNIVAQMILDNLRDASK